MNRSPLRAWATRRSRGRSRKRPTTTMRAMAMSAWTYGGEDGGKAKASFICAQHVDEQQDRDDRQILEQQHREAGAPGMGAETLGVGE